jgi:hypothetical protein
MSEYGGFENFLNISKVFMSMVDKTELIFLKVYVDAKL